MKPNPNPSATPGPAGLLNYFTQTPILRQIGHRRLARLLTPFDEDLKGVGLVLPEPDPQDDDYFANLGLALRTTDRLPRRLLQTLQTIERAASPENEMPLWRAIQCRIPGVAVSQDCALDRALELWFVAPDEFSKFIAPTSLDETECRRKSVEGGFISPSASGPELAAVSESPTSAFSIQPLAFPQNSTIQQFNPLTFPETDQQAFARLGALSPAQYDRVRHAEAKRLQIRFETLDAEVAQARTELGYDAEARAVKLPPVEPWPDPVDGCEVLHQVRARFEGAVILPPGASQILALWPTHAHCFDAFLHTPRLNLTSAVAECGKSTTVDLLATLAPRSLCTENLTAPVLFRLVAKHQPTVFLDEVDTYLTFAQELRGLINAGHKQGGCAYRCEGSNNAVRAFNAFAPMVISGIGPLHETLRSRSIRLVLLKAKEEEQKELKARFDSRHTEIEAILCRKLARWTHDNFAALKACDPPMPPGAYNRVADNWRPMFAIAQVAGGDWPQLTLEAYHHLTNQRAPEKSELPTPNSQFAIPSSQLLLADIRQIFTQAGATRLSTKQLLEALQRLPSSHYSGPATPHQACKWLARTLNPLGIKPHAMRIGNMRVKGYDAADFIEAFNRMPTNGTEGKNQ